MKKLIGLAAGVLMANANADCMFHIVNNSSWTIYAEAGFYSQPTKSVLLMIPTARSKYVSIKSDLSCLSSNSAGMGAAYINLVNGQSVGGWVYSPSTSMIRASGASNNSSDGVVGLTTTGNKLFLRNNYKPDPNLFEVTVQSAQRNISRQLGSME